MPRLTEIADPVSQQVRQQYEESPYPRWVTRCADGAGGEHIRPSARAVSGRAAARRRGAGDAGHPGRRLRHRAAADRHRAAFPEARVLAIDLSLASLAYAKRKSDAAGVAIEYAQADILALALGPAFRHDRVERRAASPGRSDARLGDAACDLLKPGGFMRLGLYSEIGRRDVVALQRIVAERGYAATEHDIRRCRQDLIAKPDPRFAPILHSPDFYSISACRDLLFHVQEHRLTLPQIGAFLAEHGLTLLGFELDRADAGTPIARAFPDDAAMTDLAIWHRFETANPDTFRGMYQFWVQKTA